MRSKANRLMPAKFLEILMTGSLEIGMFLLKQSVSIFLATAHALHLTGFFREQTKAENCWVLCIVFQHIFVIKD